MNIHEYQAKEIFRQYGISTPKGELVHKLEELQKCKEKIPGPPWVVKAQIHAGGRGKAGGIQLASSFEDLKDLTQKMLGKTLFTHQSGEQGHKVRKVLIEAGCNIDKEYYFSFTVNRQEKSISMIASKAGGVDIEEVAQKEAHHILQTSISIHTGLQAFQVRNLLSDLELPKPLWVSAQKMLLGLYQLFIDKDCSILEVNPLVQTKEGNLLALDAKINFDDNALFRHPEVLSLRDTQEEDPTEVEASKEGIAFVKLQGRIGCLVNGAGLAMATMDMIRLYGESPANFLDVGGGASQKKVSIAFRLILKDPAVKAILVNIFGGIMRCDVIAQGILGAIQEMGGQGLPVPLIVRLEGTCVEEGKKILKESGLPIISATSLKDAAEKTLQVVSKEKELVERNER